MSGSTKEVELLVIIFLTFIGKFRYNNGVKEFYFNISVGIVYCHQISEINYLETYDINNITVINSGLAGNKSAVKICTV